MGDVGERTAVNESRRALERLHQVRRQRLFEQHGHCALSLQVAGAHWLSVARVGNDNVCKPILQIVEIARQTKDRHHLGSHRDIEAVFAREAIGHTAERRDNRAQRAIVHVEHPAPRHPALVNAERISPIDVVVEHCREQIVGGSDGVKIAGKVQVDVLHRHDLRIAAAGGPAFHAERRTERRLANAQHRLFADVIERIG